MSIHNNYAWPYHVKVGDVLVNDKNNFRTVREVSYDTRAPYLPIYVTLSIQRCSWTRRPYTCLSYNDLKYGKYRPAGLVSAQDGPMDKRLNEYLRRVQVDDARYRHTLTCCDIKAVCS